MSRSPAPPHPQNSSEYHKITRVFVGIFRVRCLALGPSARSGLLGRTPDMERPVKSAEVVVALPCSSPREGADGGGGADSTVDHSDIRGSGRRPAVIIVIRRELPRTRGASWALWACRIGVLEDSPFRVRLHRCPLRSRSIHCCGSVHAACDRSMVTPMCQRNPRSSRASAVTTLGDSFPRAARRR